MWVNAAWDGWIAVMMVHELGGRCEVMSSIFPLSPEEPSCNEQGYECETPDDTACYCPGSIGMMGGRSRGRDWT